MKTYSADPGKTVYPDLKERLVVKGLGEHESPEISVEGGLVRFSRWDEDVDDRVSFVITEWDMGNFVHAWLEARMNERFAPKDDA